MKYIDNIKIRKMRLNDLHAICELFSIVFSKEISRSYLTWRYLKNPYKLNWAFVALEKGNIKGLATLSPQPYIINGDKKIFGLSGSSMIHPSLQRKGLYTKIANIMYETAYAEGCDFIIGFPNKNSHYGRITKLGWADIHEIPNFSKAVSNSQMNSMFEGELIKLQMSTLEKISKNSHFHEKERSALFYLSNDLVFLKWRFDNPLNKYYVFRDKNIDGDIIIKYFFDVKNNKQIDILTINRTNDKELNKLLKSLFSFCASNGIQKVNMWHNYNSPSYQKFELLGFKHEEPLTWFSAKKTGCRNSSLFDYRNWDISFLMSDIY